MAIVVRALSFSAVAALTLVQVGWVATAGLQPRLLPVGHVVIVGLVVSFFQV